MGPRVETKKIETEKTEPEKTEPEIGQPLVPAQKHYYPKLPRSKPVFSKANPTDDGWINYLLFFPIVKTRW